MITYDTDKKIYYVFGKPAFARRAKRDGRMPSTSAFAPMTKYGAVDYTVDYPFLRGNPDVNLRRLPDNPITPNDPDYLDTDFDDFVSFHYDATAGVNYTPIINVHSRNQANAYLTFETEALGFQYFTKDGRMYRVPTSDTSDVQFVDNGEYFRITNKRRNVAGDLLVSATGVDTGAIKVETNMGNFFPAFTG